MKHYILTRTILTGDCVEKTAARTLRTQSHEELTAFLTELNQRKLAQVFTVGFSYSETQEDLTRLVLQYFALREDKGSYGLCYALHNTIACMLLHMHEVCFTDVTAMLELKTYLEKEV